MNHSTCTHRPQLAAIRIAHALLLLAACSLAGCRPSTPSARAEPPPATPDAHDEHGHEQPEHADEVVLTPDAIRDNGIKIGQAAARELTPTLIAPARVDFSADAMAHVGSPLKGRVVEIKAKLGQQVLRDDPLVIVESPELGEAQMDLLQKRSAVDSVTPQVDLAKAAWDRARGLLEQSQGISLTEVQRREAEYKSAIAAVKTANAGATAAENRLHLLGMDQSAVATLAESGEISPRFTITAPIAGQVILREITQGELVGPDRESIMVIADTGLLWALADVPESRLASLTIGAKAWITVGSQESTPFQGTVDFISPIVDPTTRTAEVRIELARPADSKLLLRPGMFAQAQIALQLPGAGSASSTIAIPESAVHRHEGGLVVFVPVEGEDGAFQTRAIQTGASAAGFIQILSGLAEGDDYVEEGSFILKAELGKNSASHEH